MRIVVCGSIELTPKIKEIADALSGQGHTVEIPLTSSRIIRGELTLGDFIKEKEASGDGSFRKIKDDVIRYYYNLIKDSDAIVVVNEEKNGIPNYIGGNTFLEMGFAHVLGRKIFLFRSIPEMPYIDEIRAMCPVILNGDLAGIGNP